MQSNINSDNYIFSCIRNGDKKAFEALFESYYSRLIVFSFSYVRHREEACDLVQDAFISLWEKAPELAPNTNVYGYLLTIVKNKCLNHLRGKKIRAQYSQDTRESYIKDLELQSEALGLFPLEKLINDDLQQQLFEALQTLPDQCRKVFTMRCLQYMSPKEIAESLEISEKTVKNHLTKAIKLLQSLLTSSSLFLLALIGEKSI